MANREKIEEDVKKRLEKGELGWLGKRLEDCKREELIECIKYLFAENEMERRDHEESVDFLSKF